MDAEIRDFTFAGILILVTAFVWLFADIYMYVFKKETISVRMLEWSKHMMAIVFIIGFICGHWFW